MNEGDVRGITLLNSLKNILFDHPRHALAFPFKENNEVLTLLKAEGIEYDKIGADLAELDLDNLPWCVFADEQDFLTRANRHCWLKRILLLTDKIFYDVESDTTYINFTKSDSYFLISNNFYSYRFLTFLQSQDHKEGSAFYFVDYFNWDSRHVVLTSLKKDGKIEFMLPNCGLNIKGDIGLKDAYHNFVNAFEEPNRHYPKFLKTELISVLSKIDKGKRLEELIRRLNEIVYVASQNFEIYLHDLSLENLKKDFIEHKNKYFIQLREVLSKLTNQVVGLPIAVAASVFSTYKVDDSISTLILILLVFVTYTVYSVYLLKLQKEDVADMNLNFESDYNRLAESQFFKKFDNELEDFIKVKKKLSSRLRSLIGAIDLYFVLFTISSASFMVYILIQMKFAFWSIILVPALLSGGMTSIYWLTQTMRKD